MPKGTRRLDRVRGRFVLAAAMGLLLAACGGSGEPAPPTPNGNWPLAVGSDKTRLVDSEGKPFLMVADTAWTLAGSVPVEEAKRYIDLRRSQGFNTILMLATPFSRDESTVRGRAFSNGDLSKPSDKWFAGVEEVVAYAGQEGMTVGLGALWTSNNGGRAGGEMPDEEDLAAYGSYLAGVFADDPNVFYFVGGDDDPSMYMDELGLIAKGIKAVDSKALVTVHTWGKAPVTQKLAWVDFYSFQWNSNSPPYSYSDVRETAAYTPRRPVLDIEPAYDPSACCGEDTDTSEIEVRRTAWWAVTSGALGVVYGGPQETWNIGAVTEGKLDRSAVDRPAARQVAHVGEILGPHDTGALTPDWTGSVVSGDRGRYGADDYVTAATRADGSLLVAYLPRPATLTVDPAKLGANPQGQWYNPRTGTAEGEAFGLAAGENGLSTLTSPAQDDWVLLVTADPR